MALELKRRRFTVTEYHRMAKAGILGEDDRVELIDLQQNTITAYGDPTSSVYRSVRVFRPGEQIAPAAFPDRAVADILPSEHE